MTFSCMSSWADCAEERFGVIFEVVTGGMLACVGRGSYENAYLYSAMEEKDFVQNCHVHPIVVPAEERAESEGV